MQGVGDRRFAVEAPDAELDAMLKAHEAIMTSLQQFLEWARKESSIAYVAPPADRNGVLCA